jgi:hypothetical protein
MGMTARRAAPGLAMSLSVLLAGCWSGGSSNAGGCPSVDPFEREGPAPFVSMTDGSYATQRYKSHAVYIPHVTAPVVARTDNAHVLDRLGASLQAKGVFATGISAVHKGNAKITLRGPDGHRYALRVTVAC